MSEDEIGMDDEEETDEERPAPPTEGCDNLASPKLESTDFTVSGKITAGDLQFAVDAVSCLVDEAPFSFEPEGITATQTDTSQIAMVLTKFKLRDYNLSKPGVVGVKVSTLKGFIKNFTGDVSLEIADGKLILQNNVKKIKVPLFDVGYDLSKEPKLEGLEKVVFDKKEWSNVLKDAYIVSSHITFIGDAGKNLVAKAVGEDGTSADLQLTTSVSKKLLATFPLTYLLKLAPAGATTFEVELATNKPVRITAKANGNSVVYYLAPRIEM